MSIRQILYTSQALQPVTKEDCRALLTQARENNLRDGLTGMLIFVTNGTFLQVLEGASDKLQCTMQRITRDPRHEHLGIILDIQVEARSFGDWSMAFQSCDPEDLADHKRFWNFGRQQDFRSLAKSGPPIMSVMRQICLANVRSLTA